MSDAKLVNIARLMTTYNFEIEQLPDNLKCAQCKLVLKDACQLSCCCRYCRACIVDMIERGGEFCPGGSDECGESLLSCYQSNLVANKGVSRLTVKCPHDGCVHKCQLANIEEHLRECPRKGEDCPFRELGCTQDKLAADEMGGHLQHDNRRHSEILIAMMANINREVETLKPELMRKDEQIRSIMDQMIHVQNDIKSIKEEKEDLAGQVTILTEKIAERRDSDELDSARLIEHVDRKITAVMRLIESNKDDVDIQMQSVSGDIGSINHDTKSRKKNIFSVKPQALEGPGQVDARLEWLIDDDVGNIWISLQNENVFGAVHPYEYRLISENYDTGTARAQLRISFLIYADPNDGHLRWPFEARVVITVTDRDRREVCRTISRQCRIEKLSDFDCRRSVKFVFLHSELIKAGMNPSRGMLVSCGIVLGAGK